MEFIKYQGTGNDFIIADGRNQKINTQHVAELCDRRFGIGADGFMILEEEPGYDFRMVYYNSDGNLSSMCGNGGRCLAHFAHSLGLGHGGALKFLAVDGPHNAIVEENNVKLGMLDVLNWELRDQSTMVLNTGSPHFIWFIDTNPDDFDLIDFAHGVRYSPEFAEKGINVNIVQIIGKNSIAMRTYERGVEDETLSCGTGVTAAALALQIKSNTPVSPVEVVTRGGKLKVYSELMGESFQNIILDGPAVPVFKGII